MSHAMYTILIVYDNPNNLFTLRTLLTANLDTEVIEAESGVTALEKVSQQKIDLILLDIQMPELDGFETAKLNGKSFKICLMKSARSKRQELLPKKKPLRR